jgi:hypothetical protein
MVRQWNDVIVLASLSRRGPAFPRSQFPDDGQHAAAAAALDRSSYSRFAKQQNDTTFADLTLLVSSRLHCIRISSLSMSVVSQRSSGGGVGLEKPIEEGTPK